MTNPSKTLIAALLDRSGSMATIKTDTEGGYRTFLAEQAAQPGELRVTLAQFDDVYEVVYPPTPVADVPDFELKPRRMTALLDALGKFITDVGADLAALEEDDRPGHVIVVVMTDGEENASREWTVDAVRQLVTQQREQWKWEFVFLGANLDAVQVGNAYGFAADSSISYAPDAAGTRAVFNSVTNHVSRTRSGLAAGFDDADRSAAMGMQS